MHAQQLYYVYRMTITRKNIRCGPRNEARNPVVSYIRETSYKTPTKATYACSP